MLSPYGRMLSLSKHRPAGGPGRPFDRLRDHPGTASTGSGTTPLTPQAEGLARDVS